MAAPALAIHREPVPQFDRGGEEREYPDHLARARTPPIPARRPPEGAKSALTISSVFPANSALHYPIYLFGRNSYENPSDGSPSHGRLLYSAIFLELPKRICRGQSHPSPELPSVPAHHVAVKLQQHYIAYIAPFPRFLIPARVRPLWRSPGLLLGQPRVLNRPRLNDGAGQITDEVPDHMTGDEIMGTENEHAEQNHAENERKNRPGGNIGLAIRRVLVAHLAEELA